MRLRTRPWTSSPTSSLVYTFHHQPSDIFTGSFPTVLISILLVSCFVFLLSRFHSLLTCVFVTPLVSSGYLKCICEHRPNAQGFYGCQTFELFFLGKVTHKVDFSPLYSNFSVIFFRAFSDAPAGLQLCEWGSCFSTLLCFYLWKVSVLASCRAEQIFNLTYTCRPHLTQCPV